jgi:H+/Cl- antiporter ClcA
LDPNSEKHESHGIGGPMITPTLQKFATILLIGYFSLIGGASLGPEAVLVPACTIIGAYAGFKLFKKSELAGKALAAAGIMALMTAFFHSFIIGILSVFLVTKISKTKLTPQLLIIAVISSVTSYLVLNIIDPEHRYFNFPTFSWKVAAIDLLIAAVLLVAGFVATFALKYVHAALVRARGVVKITKWFYIASFAGIILGLLYILGGPLVEFTGNQSIAPLISQAPSLGFRGLLIILAVKLLVIGWSKGMGYRGGLIFPMIFIASVLVAIAQLAVHDMNFGVGMIAAITGILIGESKAHILL